jgi:thioesterase domain-containing protein
MAAITSPAELEVYLHRNIPITAAMEISVESIAADEVVLAAPLEPNINHRETLFGGSAVTICILAAWSLVHLRLTGAGIAHRLVIQRNTMSYEAPVTGRFTARARLSDESGWEQGVKLLMRHRKARFGTVAELRQGELVGGRMEADFVALG